MAAGNYHNGGKTVAVIGGGVIGTSIALQLAAAGCAVTLFEPNEPGSGCSMGNSGHIGISSITPWASPKIVRHSVAMMLDPLHPLRVTPGGALENLRWFCSFLAAARPTAVRHGTEVLAKLFATAWPDASRLIDLASARDLISDRGALQVYSSAASLAAAREGNALRRLYGIEMIELSNAEVHEAEPALGPLAIGGVLVPGVVHVRDPQQLSRRYATALTQRGGCIVARPVQAIVSQGSQGPAVMVDGVAMPFDYAVLAAGFGARRFFADLGVTVPLASERGYHIQMTGQSDLLARPISYVDGRVGFTPMLAGLRMTSGADFSRSASPVRYDQMRRIFASAKKLLPALGELKGSEWCDARPSTPDSLPIIGLAPRSPRVVIATGHGHVGLGLSGTTARLVEALVGQKSCDFNFADTAPDRAVGTAPGKPMTIEQSVRGRQLQSAEFSRN